MFDINLGDTYNVHPIENTKAYNSSGSSLLLKRLMGLVQQTYMISMIKKYRLY